MVATTPAAAAAPLLLLASALFLRGASASALDSFLAPLAGRVALNADFAPVSNASTPEECAARCLALGAQCVSFNLCTQGGDAVLACGVSEYSMAYAFSAADTCQLFTRLQPRDDSPVSQSVAWSAQAPAPLSVALDPAGLLGAAFAEHRATYLGVRSPLDMLYFFYKRAGQTPPSSAQCFGWDEWIKGSATGNFLMGAGSYLQWVADPVLAARVQQVVDGIAALQEPDGWIWAFNESDIWSDNLPDYCAGWVTRGLLDADRGGAAGAYALARQQISLFNNHSALAHFLPPNGGPSPAQPYPSGFNNVTNGGYGNGPGHMIYIQYQGMIKHSLMALSRGGTQADVDILQDLYIEQWWIDALLRGDEYGAIWHRTFFSHNYEAGKQARRLRSLSSLCPTHPHPSRSSTAPHLHRPAPLPPRTSAAGDRVRGAARPLRRDRQHDLPRRRALGLAFAARSLDPARRQLRAKRGQLLPAELLLHRLHGRERGQRARAPRARRRGPRGPRPRGPRARRAGARRRRLLPRALHGRPRRERAAADAAGRAARRARPVGALRSIPR